MTTPTDGDRTRLASLLTRYAEEIQAEIRGAMLDSGELSPFYAMMAYHFGWVDQSFAPVPARAGKSLRPSLCLMLAEGLGADIRLCVPLAAGIEVLHNFSLVHDDIEDRSVVRRGRPAVWSIWGDAHGINVGDGLFSLAHLLWMRSPIADTEPAAFCAMLRSLERAVMTLCEGQFLDMSAEGNLDLSSSAYLRMIARKTATLIGESAWIGARAAGADEATRAVAREFGTELGLAFQIRDDLLGIWGDEAETGKSASSDIATRKMTLPIILALEAADPQARAAIRARYGAPPVDADHEDQVRALLDAAGAARRTAEVEQRHWQAAMDALDRLPLEGQWRHLIRLYARSFVERRA